MAAAIEILREEHRNIARLLNALDHQLGLLARGKAPDYEIVRGIADYFCDYPDRCHHPKENVIFEALRARFPQDAAAAGDLIAEHRDTATRARAFRELVDELFREAVVPRDRIAAAAKSFVDNERRHMRLEEEQFFRVAEGKLGPDDWRRIDATLAAERDPLFGSQVEETFRVLRERLIAWERDYKPG